MTTAAELDELAADRARRKDALTAAVDRLVAGGLPKVYVSHLTYRGVLECMAKNPSGVMRWAKHFGLTPSVEVAASVEHRRVWQDLCVTVDVDGGHVTIRHLTSHRLVGGPDVTLVKP